MQLFIISGVAMQEMRRPVFALDGSFVGGDYDAISYVDIA